jgi:hypothetical protein
MVLAGVSSCCCSNLQHAKADLEIFPASNQLCKLLLQLLPPSLREHWAFLLDGSTAPRSLARSGVPVVSMGHRWTACAGECLRRPPRRHLHGLKELFSNGEQRAHQLQVQGQELDAWRLEQQQLPPGV